jgi:hypothetical protein
MKYLYVILTIITIFLAGIALRLVDVGIVLKHHNETAQLLIKANQSLITSNQQLAEEIISLRKQIIDLETKVLKK